MTVLDSLEFVAVKRSSRPVVGRLLQRKTNWRLCAVKRGHAGANILLLPTTLKVGEEFVVSLSLQRMVAADLAEVPHQLSRSDYGDHQSHSLRRDWILPGYRHGSTRAKHQTHRRKRPVLPHRARFGCIMAECREQQPELQVYLCGGVMIGGCPRVPPPGSGVGACGRVGGGFGGFAHLFSPMQIVSFCRVQKGMKVSGVAANNPRHRTVSSRKAAQTTKSSVLLQQAGELL